ncbi:putative electron transfer flavoprotein FixA [Eggerthellaceae bacterium zg-1084]|uniref:Electron transfer flavoprotein small subunit n=1 Tax=Berryella wangjianweii TaxID=2734634 RepID=A0A6M8IZA4_9ACTN|nr:putative electron transfer flavoprotein FixA [Berryella wangjianweii]NPD30360.1 putative electron transfer flavoprotein FixA [Berryella wangjianweii]QKF07040.1 putative electron transfer flavoprotein FixA [Berryella wangjianweii]
MDIIVAFKVVPDDQDIQVAPDGSLDLSKAKKVVSAYDLNAIEAAAQLAAQAGDSRVTGLSAGPLSIDDGKLKKNVLARGVDELTMVVDERCEGMDARATACVLAEAVRARGSFDLVLCGGGSADDYAQQVDVHLGCELGVPSIGGVVSIEPQGASVVVERVLEDRVETVEVPLPAVVAVLPDIAEPRIPGMKDILAAGKRPMSASPAGEVPAAALVTASCEAPEQAERRCEVADAGDEGAVERFAQALRAAL